MSQAPTVHDKGTIAIPEAVHRIEPTARDQLDAAIEELRGRAEAWLETTVEQRIALLDELIQDTYAVSEEWVEVACDAKRILRGTPREAEEWFGPVLTLRHMRLMKRSLEDIRDHGRPQLPGEPTVNDHGRVVVPVLPSDPYDRVLYNGFGAEVWLQRHVGLHEFDEHLAPSYRSSRPDRGRVCLVLGAGNQSMIPPTDALSKLFVEHQVVVLKMNPVNEYVGPVLERGMRALIERGFLRIVYGGADEGKYLTGHDGFDTLHMTGSDKTHDAIVFGGGEEGRRRKEQREPLIDKPFTSELGNVSPVIVVPGPWSAKDLDFHGRNLATMLTQNGGFNCIAVRAIVTHGSWSQRTALLDAIRDALRTTTPYYPYYPGAEDRWEQFVEAHPDAERFGPEGPGCVPWTFIPGLDADDDDEIAFETEAFTGVTGEVPLDAPRSVPAFLEQAVEFCNERLWGTLGASIIVHPRSMKDPEVAAAVKRAIADLRYGAVVVNHWMAAPFAVMTTTWGAYPGHELHDIQSGRGVVHNTFMLDEVEKSVAWGPFRPPVEPVWFASHGNAHEALRRLTDFEADPSWAKVPPILWYGLRP